MKRDLSPTVYRRLVETLKDDDFIRVAYCYQIGSTFVSISQMEDMIINSILVCDKVKTQSKLADGAENSKVYLEKRDALRSSTLGNLINILSKHDLNERDGRYLKWVKEKRDFFVHRLFRYGAWPGDLDQDECVTMIRQLGYLEIIFRRATDRIAPILDRSGLMGSIDW